MAHMRIYADKCLAGIPTNIVINNLIYVLDYIAESYKGNIAPDEANAWLKYKLLGMTAEQTLERLAPIDPRD